jgi:hypothetical protein
MNFVLLCDKKKCRDYEPVIRKAYNSVLLGVETTVKPNFIHKILDEYNPHGLVVVHRTPVKGNIDVLDIITLLKSKRPNFRIIYIYGNIRDEHDFLEIYDKLIALKVFDIVTGQEWNSIFPTLIKSPLTLEQLNESLKSSESNGVETVAEIQAEEKPIYYDVEKNTNVKLDREALTLDDFDMLNIAEIIEKNETEKTDIRNITIGLTELQHHIGCTHVSFEIGAFLQNKKKSVCVIICDDSTYKSLCSFYDIPDNYTTDGFFIKGLNVFPFAKLDEVQSNFNYIVCDFGFPRPEHQKAFNDSAIKIMLCSAADWDVSVTMDFINKSTVPYAREINYCFYPISQARFISFNKQLMKAGCKSYRIQTSAGCFQPCDGNINVYLDIINRYTDIMPTKKRRKKW